MAFDFPASPTVDQVFGSYKWDGEKWVSAAGAGSGGASVLVSATPPAGAPDNALWWESDTGLTFIRYNDGNSTAWVAIGGDGGAPLASPAFTGNPTAPTPPLGDNDTSIATTAFVNAAVGLGLFLADRNDANQTGLTANAWNKVLFTNEVKDLNSWFDNALSRFTPLLAGTYQFALVINVSTAATTGQTPQAALWKNGALARSGTYMGSTPGPGAGFISTVSAPIPMNGTTDYVEPYVAMPPGITTVNGNSNACYFYGYRVGA
jgi:hypothetical protein